MTLLKKFEPQNRSHGDCWYTITRSNIFSVCLVISNILIALMFFVYDSNLAKILGACVALSHVFFSRRFLLQQQAFVGSRLILREGQYPRLNMAVSSTCFELNPEVRTGFMLVFSRCDESSDRLVIFRDAVSQDCFRALCRVTYMVQPR